jgi:hypothetical protein
MFRERWVVGFLLCFIMGIKGYKKLVKNKYYRQINERRKQEFLEEWNRTRYDDDEIDKRQNIIYENGLPSLIHLDLLHDKLWAIVVEPVDGFTHLSNEQGLREAVMRGDVYHVSICFDDDIKTPWQQKALVHLHRLYDWQTKHTFKIARFGGGLSAILDSSDSVYKEIVDLHRYGKYHYKDIHISL